SFLGIRNRFEVDRRDGDWLWMGERLALGSLGRANGSYRLFLRPEDVKLARPDGAPPDGTLVLGEGQVTDVLFGGDRCEYAVECKGMSIASQSPGPIPSARRGDRVTLWASR